MAYSQESSQEKYKCTLTVLDKDAYFSLIHNDLSLQIIQTLINRRVSNQIVVYS